MYQLAIVMAPFQNETYKDSASQDTNNEEFKLALKRVIHSNASNDTDLVFTSGSLLKGIRIELPSNYLHINYRLIHALLRTKRHFPHDRRHDWFNRGKREVECNVCNTECTIQQYAFMHRHTSKDQHCAHPYSSSVYIHPTLTTSTSEWSSRLPKTSYTNRSKSTRNR